MEKWTLLIDWCFNTLAHLPPPYYHDGKCKGTEVILQTWNSIYTSGNTSCKMYTAEYVWIKFVGHTADCN